MSIIHVGIGEYRVTNDPEDILKTFGLGSCVAVMMYNRIHRMGALIHIALPDSSIDPEKAVSRPAYFADTGLALMFNEISSMGTSRKDVWIKIAGGSSIMDDKRTFDIGRRNALAVKKWLWKNRFGVLEEDIGGNESRTVTFKVEDGDIVISLGNKDLRHL